MEKTKVTSICNSENADQYIKIGALYPLTGEFASIGKNCARGLEFAVDIINNYWELPLPLACADGLPNLGNRKIKVIFADTEGNTTIGQREAKRLIVEENVTALVGAYNSDVTRFASMEAEVLHVPFITPDASAHSLTQRGFKYFFRTQAEDIMYTKLFFELLKDLSTNENEMFSLAMLSDQSYTSIEGTESELNFAMKYNYKITDLEIYSSTEESLIPQIERIKASRAGVMLVAQQDVTDAVETVKILKQLNYAPKGFLVQDSVYCTPEIIAMLGADSNYIISRLAWAIGVGKKKPLAAKINKLYYKKYGDNLSDEGARSFTGLLVLAAAINSAGSTKSKAIRESLKRLYIPEEKLIMPWIGVKFDNNGQNILADGILGQMIDGEYKVIWPKKYSETCVVWPAPKWTER